MKIICSILFSAITFTSSAQSAKKQAEMMNWATIAVGSVDWNYMKNLEDLCAFYHNGVYKGKVYDKYKNQEPSYYVAKLHASTGCMICQYNMGLALTRATESIDKYNNYASGLVQLQKSAESGYTPAIWAMVNIYSNPNTKNIAEAKRYLDVLIRAGDAAASAKLKMLNESESNPFALGEAAYGRKDYPEALRLWTIDYQQNKNGVAARNIALMYYTGTGFVKDIKKAHDYFGYGYTLEDAPSIYYCGKIWYDEGNYSNAADIWEYAKQKGYPVVQADLDFVKAEREKVRISNQQKYESIWRKRKRNRTVKLQRKPKEKLMLLQPRITALTVTNPITATTRAPQNRRMYARSVKEAVFLPALRLPHWSRIKTAGGIMCIIPGVRLPVATVREKGLCSTN